MALFFVLPFVAICLTIIYYFLTWPYDYWKNQGVQTAKPLVPGFGNVLPMVFFRENLNFICNRLYKTCQPNSSMLGMFVFRTPALMVRDPELVQTVLIKEFANFNSNLIYLDENQDRLVSKHPFFAIGDSWKRSRKPMNIGMSQKKLKVMFESMQRLSANFDNYFSQIGHKEIELLDLTYIFICEILCQVGLGIKPEGNFLVMIKKLFESTWFQATRQLLNFFIRGFAKFTGITFTSTVYQTFFCDLARSIAEKHKTEKGMNHEDFLHMVMENSEDVDEAMVLSVLGSLFVDGYDTVANVAGIALYRLAWNQGAQDKLRKEILDTLEKCDDKLTYDLLKDMVYLDHVINETIRLNPILEIYAKICNEKTVLVGSDGQKCTVQPGNFIIIPTQSLHTDEKYWVNPDTFDPDRFDRDGVTKFAFLPFGEGPRMCPGMRFGLLEVKVLLISVLRKCRVNVTGKTVKNLQMDPSSFFPVVKEKLIVQLEKI